MKFSVTIFHFQKSIQDFQKKGVLKSKKLFENGKR
jgi:hypothetical protein